MNYEITPEMEVNSTWGAANPTYHWYWQEIEHPSKEPTGTIGRLRATTEMESLDRLREAFPQVGTIRWIKRVEYERLLAELGEENATIKNEQRHELWREDL